MDFGIGDAIAEWFYGILLDIDQFFCNVLSLLYSFFDVFAGLKSVKYDGETKPLIDIFFKDTSAGRIYSYMAAIGIVVSFAFVIYAVIKKIFDIDDKIKNSIGGILGNWFKCILFILLMNFIIAIVLRSSSLLMDRVIYVFNNESLPPQSREQQFDNSDYATMARVINTIGNSSLNPSYDSKYNINSCYNEIRLDLIRLDDKGVFNHSYDGDEYKDSWQYYLTKLANAHDLSAEQNLDEYDSELTDAMKDVMQQISVNKKFKPVSEYKSNIVPIQSNDTPFGALIFLAGTSTAAKNSKYNKNPDIFDTLRYEYIKPNGKDYNNDDQVKQDFNISLSTFDHLAIIILGILLARVFLSLCINCVARIFNMILLYLIAPVFIAVTPLDDGEKTKQWSIAFIVQAFGVFGAVFGIRILMMFVTIIFNSKLVLFDSSTMNFFAKILMIFAVACTVEQASKIVTGILANNAGFQSIQAGDVGSAGAGRIIGGAKALGGKAMGAAGFALNHSFLGSLKNMASSAYEHSDSKLAKTVGFLTGTGPAGSKGYYDKKHEKAEKAKEEAEKEAKNAAKEGGNSGDNGGSNGGGSTPDNKGSVGNNTSSGTGSLGGGSSNGNSRGGAKQAMPRKIANASKGSAANQGQGNRAATNMHDFFGVPRSSTNAGKQSINSSNASARNQGANQKNSSAGSASRVDGKTTNMWDFMGVQKPNSGAQGGTQAAQNNNAPADNKSQGTNNASSGKQSQGNKPVTNMHDFFGIPKSRTNAGKSGTEKKSEK